MHHSFKALVWSLATAISWATCEVLYAASMHTRGTLYHSALWLSRGWAFVALACLWGAAFHLYHAHRNHEFTLPIPTRTKQHAPETNLSVTHADLTDDEFSLAETPPSRHRTVW